MSSTGKWLIKEIKHVLPAIIYFCIAFNLIHFTIGLTLPADAPRYFSILSVTIGGLIIGKIMMIADAFAFFNRFNSYPLIVVISWKMFFYFILIFIYRCIEGLTHVIWHFGFKVSILKILVDELTSPVFWAAMIWATIFLLFFVIFREITSYLGSVQFRQMFFGKRQ